jgi:hypothetical protein
MANASKPNIARAYDHMLGGKGNFPADRELAARILDEAAGLVTGFVRRLAPGSFLIISIGTHNNAALADQVIATYNAGDLRIHDRTQIADYFAGLELVEPGLTLADG